MLIKVARSCALLLAIALVSFCQKQDKANDTIATIDGTKITKDAYNSFWEMRRLYPSYTGDFFPGERSLSTYLVQVLIVSDLGDAKSYSGKLKSNPSWEWRERYFPAQMYLQKVLDGNLGFTDKEMESYYKAHLSSYKVKTQVEVPVAQAGAAKAKDTSKAKNVVPQTVKKDSIVQRSLPEVKDQVMKALFLAKYPVPDSLFRKHDPKDTSKVDTTEVRNRWLYMVRGDLPNFFMRKSYEDKYKQKFPDSLKAWYGPGKVVTDADMDVILSWLPESQRAMYNTPAGKADLAKWLLKWKLFSDDAKKSGFSSQDNVKDVLNWAWKVEIATNYVNAVLVPKAKAGASIDTQMCVYAMWDDRGSANHKDTASVNRTVARYVSKAVTIKVDSLLYSLRKSHTVAFTKAEYKDEQSGNPVTMIAHADSMRDTGNTSEASSVYRALVTSFPFTPEGKKAYAELAKVQSEKGEYSDAVKNYRDYLVLVNDKSKRCNTFFMIGFIYDEYLNKSDLAEVNYKWVLKNTPECELANDAEFMTLHLGEPMNSVEELRAEARRQGRKVDTTTPAPEMMNSDTGAKAPAKKM